MLDLANGPAIGPAAYAGGSARLNLSGTGGPGTLSTRARVGCNAPCLVPVLEGDGHRRRAHRWARARSRRDVRAARAGAPGPSATRSRCGCWATREPPRRPPRTRFVRAYRALAGYDATRILRAAPAAVAGHDRPEPVPNATRATRDRRPGAALARRRSRTGDAAGAGRDGPRRHHRRRSPNAAPRGTTGPASLRPCRPPTGPPSSCDTSTACPIPISPSPSDDPRAPSRPRSTAAWRCCAPPSRRRTDSSARR